MQELERENKSLITRGHQVNQLVADILSFFNSKSPEPTTSRAIGILLKCQNKLTAVSPDYDGLCVHFAIIIFLFKTFKIWKISENLNVKLFIILVTSGSSTLTAPSVSAKRQAQTLSAQSAFGALAGNIDRVSDNATSPDTTAIFVDKENRLLRQLIVFDSV